jgi:hypothetical protein
MRRSVAPPDPKDVSELRRRYDIEQITPPRITISASSA